MNKRIDWVRVATRRQQEIKRLRALLSMDSESLREDVRRQLFIALHARCIGDEMKIAADIAARLDL